MTPLAKAGFSAGRLVKLRLKPTSTARRLLRGRRHGPAASLPARRVGLESPTYAFTNGVIAAPELASNVKKCAHVDI